MAAITINELTINKTIEINTHVVKKIIPVYPNGISSPSQYRVFLNIEKEPLNTDVLSFSNLSSAMSDEGILTEVVDQDSGLHFYLNPSFVRKIVPVYPNGVSEVSFYKVYANGEDEPFNITIGTADDLSDAVDALGGGVGEDVTADEVNSGAASAGKALVADGHGGASWEDVSSYKEVTYSELVSLRSNSQLIAGCLYKITDYVTTVNQAECRSAGHQFDVIVEAISSNVLSEKAHACLHSGDTYFAGCNLNAWQVFYCLDNDAARFAWADTTNGKGVIYRLIDEFFNDVPYDFKNVQFKRYKVTKDTSSLNEFDGLYYGCKDFSGSFVYPQGYTIDDDTDFIWLYTFGGLDSDSEPIDMSIQGNLIPNDESHIYGCHHNSFGPTDASYIYPEEPESEWQQFLGNNVFFVYNYDDDEAFYGCFSNTIGSGFYSNTIGFYFKFNTIGSGFNNNTIGSDFNNNTIGSDFKSNTIGSGFYYNTIGYGFYYNTIGSGFYSNTIGFYFYYNTIGSDFKFNTIGSGFNNNTIGSYFSYNTIDSDFNNNTIGSDFSYNTIGSYFSYNTIGASYIRRCIFDNGIQYISFTSDDTSASNLNYIQNVHVHLGVVGASTLNPLTISVPDRALAYSTDYYVTNSQEIYL